MNFFWVFIGGGLGSLARYEISLFIRKFGGREFPLATLISNLLATSILGIILYLTLSKWPGQKWIYPFIAVGFCGGFSTFSTFSSETLNLFQSGNHWLAVLNVFLSVISGVALLFFLQRML